MSQKQHDRLSREVVQRVTGLLDTIRPGLLAKYGLSEWELDRAIANGVGTVVIELTRKTGDFDEMDDATKALGERLIAH